VEPRVEPDALESATLSYREALRLALREEMARDERVFLIGEELRVFGGAYKVLAGLLEEFGPERVIETPVAEHGLLAEVVDLRSLRPLDMETVTESVARTNRAVLVEEGWPSYGVTAELAARIQHASSEDLDAPVERVGSAEFPLPYAKNLETAALPNEERICEAVLASLGISGR